MAAFIGIAILAVTILATVFGEYRIFVVPISIMILGPMPIWIASGFWRSGDR